VGFLGQGLGPEGASDKSKWFTLDFVQLGFLCVGM
jgi:hypothetical protein